MKSIHLAFGGLSVALALVISCLSYEVSALSISGTYSCTRDYLVESVKQKLIKRSTLVAEYMSRLKRVNEEYQEALDRGQLEGLSESEKSDFYYKIVVRELLELRKQIEAGKVGQAKTDSVGEDDSTLGGCIDPDAMNENWSPAEDFDDDDDDDDDEFKRAGIDPKDIDADRSKELELKLKRLEDQAAKEVEMGWSLDPATKEALTLRARSVLGELLNNEIRQLAIAIIQTYLVGGTLGPIFATIFASVKFKVAEYLMNSLLDFVSNKLGKRIQIVDVEDIGTTQATNAVPAT